MLQAGIIDDDIIGIIARDPCVDILLVILDRLHDAGDQVLEARLRNSIAPAIDLRRLHQLLADGRLGRESGRAALSLLTHALPQSSGTMIELLAAIASDTQNVYGLRMNALMLLGDNMECRNYQELLNEMSSLIDPDTQFWSEGVRRLKETVAGPHQLAGPAWDTMSLAHIEQILARPYPAMLDDIAIRLDLLLGHANPSIERGVSDALLNFVAELSMGELTQTDHVAMARVATLSHRVLALELAPAEAAVEVPRRHRHRLVRLHRRRQQYRVGHRHRR